MKFQSITLTAILVTCATVQLLSIPEPKEDSVIKQIRREAVTEELFMKTFDGRHDKKVLIAAQVAVATLNPLHIICYQKIKNGYQNALSSFIQTPSAKNFFKTTWFGLNRGVAISNMVVTAVAPWYFAARFVREYKQTTNEIERSVENLRQGIKAYIKKSEKKNQKA